MKTMTCSFLVQSLAVDAEEDSRDVRVEVTLTERQVDTVLALLTVQHAVWYGERRMQEEESDDGASGAETRRCHLR